MNTKLFQVSSTNREHKKDPGLKFLNNCNYELDQFGKLDC